VQTHEEYDNSTATRTTGAIALRPTGNQQDGYYFYSLTTGRHINHNRWTLLQMPNDVIDHVRNLGAKLLPMLAYFSQIETATLSPTSGRRLEFRSFLGHAGLRFLLSSAFIVSGSCRLTLLVHLKSTRFRLFVSVHKYCHLGIHSIYLFIYFTSQLELFFSSVTWSGVARILCLKVCIMSK
jgi:hypothetical protein